ncbi:hypothetical protein ACFSTH_09730 [Paenibacillus yanchengensis]|uniref:DUF4183 domain-containing protein n=1 Tax=Paenibacillus yanchengensis TaxID=2035833 RepID=A0ABW4YI71_9BACL
MTDFYTSSYETFDRVGDNYYCQYCGCQHDASFAFDRAPSHGSHPGGGGHGGGGQHGGGHGGHGGGGHGGGGQHGGGHGGHGGGGQHGGGHGGHGGGGQHGGGHGGHGGGGIFGPWGFPLPLPIPIPIPVPQPYPQQQPYVTVIINGNRYTVPYRQGMSIYDALASTGIVAFTNNYQIAAIAGIPIGGTITYQLSLNGRVIPTTMLNYPVNAYDTIELRLVNL